MSSSGDQGEGMEQPPFGLSRERLEDLLWKAVATLLVAFLIYALLHFGSQLMEFQGG